LGLRLVDPGNLVTANSATPLVVVAQIHPITVIFTLAEDSLPQVQQQMRGGKALPVGAYDRTQQKLLEQGKLITIDNQIDTVTGTVKLRAQFDNAKSILFPNEFVNTRLLVKTLENQTLIPSSAVQHNGTVDFVYLIQNNKAIMRTVKSGITDGGNTAVTGINPGDVVANSSFQKLTSGTTITISKVTIPATSTDTTEGAP
jgi:multidrug efflux system membrane fusion protein